MALAHKFTWGAFLKKHPEFKEKKIKRTSSEGQKAFEKAFKEFAKHFLKEREAKIGKERERTAKARTELVTRLKAVDGKKWHLKARKLNQRIGRLDSYLAKLEGMQKKATQLAKNV